MPSLSSSLDVDQLVSVKGMVIRISPILPEPSIAFFLCSTCQHFETVEVDRGHIHGEWEKGYHSRHSFTPRLHSPPPYPEPTLCAKCNGQKTFQVVHNRCVFTDRQMVKLQETPEKVPDGQTPQTVLVYAFDKLVDTVGFGAKSDV